MKLQKWKNAGKINMNQKSDKLSRQADLLI